MSLNELRTLVDRASSRWPEPAWAVLEGKDPHTGRALVFSACTSAKYLLNPLFDTVCVAQLPYHANEGGMPARSSEKDRVDAFEDRVTDALGDQVLALCRSTGDGQRRIWFYLTAESGPGRRILERVAAAHPGSVELRFAWDPGWRELPV